MDCIKVKSEVQAMQEIGDAKEMIAGHDYAGARAKLLGVRDIFPALDHIDGMIAVCDILHSAGLCFLDRGIDWYWVLQLIPAAGEFDILYQYNKLCTLLEPIMLHNYPGAESAMKTIGEAFSVLSNPDRRRVFDMKRTASFESYGSENSMTRGFQLAVHVAALQSQDVNGSLIKQKWSEEDFVADQIWAVHDVPDSMSRRYVVVKNVVSGNEVCVTLLEPHLMSEEEISWSEEGLPVACGSFTAGETTLNLGMHEFAHCVNYEKSTSKLYRIYPKKGEIWAMYKNWNGKWKHSNFSNCQYLVVEIITDLFEETGLIVGSLREVAGLTSVFERQVCDGFELVRGVPITEMLRFSHRIATLEFPREEAVAERYWHLHPNALPTKSQGVVAAK